MDGNARGNVLGNLVPARYIVSTFCCLGLAIIYGMKVNLSMAMVGMLNHTALRANNTIDENLRNSTDAAVQETDHEDGPFLWNSNVQGIILSGYYWGYIVSQIPGGRMAELYSAKWVLFSSVAITAVCTVLSPVMAEIHYMALTSMRVLEGIGGGFAFPSITVLMAKWSPPSERSFMATLAYSGPSLGTVVTLLMTGILTAKAGWPSSFYVTSGISTIWCLLWVVLVQDSPQKQVFISVQERNMIVESLGGKVANRMRNETPAVPWRAVFTSSPFLGLLIAHFCCNWGWFMFITELPFYMKQVFHFNMTENTLYVAPPFFTQMIFATGLSIMLDWLQGRNTITTTTARKIATMCATLTASACLLLLSFIGDNPITAVVIMSIGVTSLGGHFCGVISNHIDIAPNFAGTLYALTSTISTIPGIIVPIFAGAVTRNNQTIEAWRIVFLATVGIYSVETIVYLTFGSANMSYRISEFMAAITLMEMQEADINGNFLDDTSVEEQGSGQDAAIQIAAKYDAALTMLQLKYCELDDSQSKA